MDEAREFEFEMVKDKPLGKRPKELPRRRRQDAIEIRYKMAEYECQSRKKNNFKWLISLDDFRWLCSRPCWYCDGKLGKVIFGKGLDRIDSLKDYTMENVYPCCTTCNRIKGHDLTASEAKAIIAMLLIFRKGKQEI